MRKPKRVLFITEYGDSSSSYYRAYLPAKGLQSLGYEAGLVSTMVQLENGVLTGLTPQGELMQPPHIIVCRRMNDPKPGTINDSGKFQSCKSMYKLARQMGQQVYIDIDDDPWNVPEWNPAYGNLTDYELDLWADDMSTVNGVLVSTPAIAASVALHSKATAIHICCNGIDPTVYKYKRSGDDIVRLGWLGTMKHRGADLKSIFSALWESLSGVNNVEFWHLGYTPGEGIEDSLLTLPAPIREKAWVVITELPRALADIDCAIVPMIPHPFNNARSNVTGLALCAAGVPFVASVTPEYKELWRMGAGYLADSHDSWVQGIRMLTQPEYKDARNDIRTAGLQVVQTFTPEKMAKQYDMVFDV